MQNAIAVTSKYRLLDGKEYEFAKLGLDAWAEFCEWINSGLDRPRGHPIDIEEMLKHAMTMRGMRWLLWRSLSEKNPGIELDQIGTLVDFQLMEEIVENVMDMPGEDGADPPTQESSP